MINLNLTSSIAKALLNKGSQFTNAFASFAKHTLGSSGHDDDFGVGWGTTNFNTGIAILSKLLNFKIYSSDY
jgi:hypothetical protein